MNHLLPGFEASQEEVRADLNRADWRSSAKGSVVVGAKAHGDYPDAILAKALEAAYATRVDKDGVFAASLLAGFRKYHSFTGDEGKAPGKHGTRHWAQALVEKANKPVLAQAPSVAQVQTIGAIPDGRYAVDHRRYQVDNVVGGKWDGWVFIKDGSEYSGDYPRRVASAKPGEGLRFSQNPHRDDRSDIEAIARDPRAASIQYGKITGSCGICGRTLENEESVARGIGPICAGKYGW